MMSLVSLRQAANTTYLMDSYYANSSKAASSKNSSKRSSRTNLACDAESTHSTPQGSERSSKKWFSKLSVPKALRHNSDKHNPKQISHEAVASYRLFGMR